MNTNVLRFKSKELNKFKTMEMVITLVNEWNNLKLTGNEIKVVSHLLTDTKSDMSKSNYSTLLKTLENKGVYNKDLGLMPSFEVYRQLNEVSEFELHFKFKSDAGETD
jgi:hypothetical protein